MSSELYGSTNINNEILTYHGLSLEALGLYVFLVSLPENEAIIKSSVLKKLYEIGDHKFNRIWVELCDCCLVEKIQHTTAKGRFNGAGWKVNQP